MYKKLNFAAGVLASDIADNATEITLKAGHTIITDIGETNKFVGVFFDKEKSSPFHDTTREIVEAYRTNTNVFTIARAKEGTDAKAWVEGDNFMLVATSAVFNEYETAVNAKENVANKKTTITDSDVDYPTCKAVNTGLSGKQNTLGFTPENVANKKTTITDSDVDYPTGKAVKTAVDAKQDALGYIAENVANKKTSLTDNSDTYYPTQKAVKTALDAKQDTLTFGIANTNAVKIDDAFVADNDYAKFTANGIEGVPYSTVLSDIGAQAALGYTPENVANKETTALDTSTTKYPCNNVVKEAVDAKQDSLGYTAENVANKKTSLTDNSDTYYPTQKAVKTALDAKQDALGFTPENVANKKTSLADNSDTYYPSQKAVKTAVDAKQDALGFTPENVANKKTTITDSDDDYLTSRAVKTAVDTKMANPMTTQGDIIYGGSSGTPTRLSKGTAGQVLTMNSGATAPQWSNPTAGGISWSAVTTDTTMAIDTGSLANKGTLLTLTLPATSAVGKTVRVAGMNTGLWKIAQASNQYIKFGNLSTTTGTGGSLSSTQAYDAVELVCIEADKGWVVVSSIGNITVV